MALLCLSRPWLGAVACVKRSTLLSQSSALAGLFGRLLKLRQGLLAAWHDEKTRNALGMLTRVSVAAALGVFFFEPD